MARPRKRLDREHIAVPENLNLEELVKRTPPNIPCFSIERASLVVEVVYRAAGRTKARSDDAFVPIPTRFLIKIARDYAQYLRWLEEVGVLEVDHKYVKARVPGAVSRCKGYRFHPVYRTLLKWHSTGNESFGKLLKPSAKTSNRTGNELIANSTIPVFHFPHDVSETVAPLEGLKTQVNRADVLARLLKVFDLVEVDTEGLEDLWQRKGTANIERNATTVLLGDMRNRSTRGRLRRNTGRLYTPVTQLPRSTRQFLSIRGYESLSILDIKSCQPYLAIYLARSSPELVERLGAEAAVQEWIEVVLEHDIYRFLSYFFAEVHGEIHSRDRWKKLLLRILNGPAGRTHEDKGKPFREKELFEHLFPEMNSLLNHFKQELKSKLKSKRSNLSLFLQQLESEIMLWNVCPRVLDAGIPVLTVHDALVVPSIHAAEVRAIMEEEFGRVVGTRPVVKEATLGEDASPQSDFLWLPDELGNSYRGPWKPFPWKTEQKVDVAA